MSFQSGRATSVAAFLFLALATCFVCFARTTSAQDADATLDRSTDRLLLLMNGRVIKGRPSDNFDGYVVEKPTGKLLISTDQVRLEATSLQEAYRKQRKTMLVPTAENHFALAQWCLLYKLFHESRQELRDALELKPSYEPARRMLQRLEKALAPEFSKSTVPATKGQAVERSVPTQATSLAGLSRKTAYEFVQKVQPILINKCANAACHGSSSRNDFRLFHVRSGRGSHRNLVQKNLETVLRYVSLEKSERSPLLVVPQRQHDFSTRIIFSGKNGKRQFSTLRDWVRRVSQEAAINKKQEQSQSFPLQEGSSRNFSTEFRSDENQRVGKSTSKDDRQMQTTPVTEATNADDRFFKELLREKQPDAFDPEPFNRATRGK